MKTFFAGRETDIQRLMAFAADAFAGRGSVAFVTGEAGIGKTTLAEELIRRLQKVGWVNFFVNFLGKLTKKLTQPTKCQQNLDNMKD